MRTAALSILAVAAIAAGIVISPFGPFPALRWPWEAQPREPELFVFPRAAANLPVLDLAELVAAVLPAKGTEHLDWDYLVGSPLIAWQTNGVGTATGDSLRIGLVRVRAGERASTVLRRSREELAWTVIIGTGGAPKFGPNWIRILPGVFPDQQCFGTRYAGCTFTAAQALASAKLTSMIICRPMESGKNKIEVYAVSAPRKGTSLLVYNNSGGSGGEISELTIRPMSDRAEVCRSAAMVNQPATQPQQNKPGTPARQR